MADQESPQERAPGAQVVYWHRELPPLEAEPLGQHAVEATSRRVPGTIAHREELWHACYDDLMIQATIRLEQEVARLGGHYAHVLDEVIDGRRDEVKGEAWLRGHFAYVLYRRAPTSDRVGTASVPQRSSRGV